MFLETGPELGMSSPAFIVELDQIDGGADIQNELLSQTVRAGRAKRAEERRSIINLARSGVSSISLLDYSCYAPLITIHILN